MNLKKLHLLLYVFTIISYETEKFIPSDGKEMEVLSSIGIDVFDIEYEFSQVGLETLMGTNNQR